MDPELVEDLGVRISAWGWVVALAQIPGRWNHSSRGGHHGQGVVASTMRVCIDHRNEIRG